MIAEQHGIWHGVGSRSCAHHARRLAVTCQHSLSYAWYVCTAHLRASCAHPACGLFLAHSRATRRAHQMRASHARGIDVCAAMTVSAPRLCAAVPRYRARRATRCLPLFAARALARGARCVRRYRRIIVLAQARALHATALAGAPGAAAYAATAQHSALSSVITRPCRGCGACAAAARNPATRVPRSSCHCMPLPEGGSTPYSLCRARTAALAASALRLT